jgi:hypothetical protein
VPVDAVLPLEAVLAGRTVHDALAAFGLVPESREDLTRLLGEADEAAEERLKKRMAREGLTPRDLLRRNWSRGAASGCSDSLMMAV